MNMIKYINEYKGGFYCHFPFLMKNCFQKQCLYFDVFMKNLFPIYGQCVSYDFLNIFKNPLYICKVVISKRLFAMPLYLVYLHIAT